MNQALQGSLLLVDDEVPITRALHRALRTPLGHRVNIVTCNSGEAAIGELMARRFDVIVSDLRMPDMGGMELLLLAADIQPSCVRMILTGTADFATAQEAVNKFGLYRYLTKPWDIDELVQHISSALKFSVEQWSQKDHALQWGASQGKVSAQTLEMHRLEALEPGITRVEWDAAGCVILPSSL
ncbi:response regulator [Hydrogenophaga sp.]|uniref:response regulator n=1 Tax=Hydrogenophaga sp. TaxID=1904254 RepID=UPI0025C4647A|nr:response regulator [Hydrogenophaga sp.]